MELWIRSQDKSQLLQVNNVQIKEYNGYSYITTDIDDDEIELGEYGFHNSQRALEVLDEIQDFIEKYHTVTAELDEYGDVANVEHHKKVYEMPKE